MLIIVDNCNSLEAVFTSLDIAGVAARMMGASDFGDWMRTASPREVEEPSGFLIGECEDRARLPQLIRCVSNAPVIAVSTSPSVAQTLELFASGVDDVVRRNAHALEILARFAAIRRRQAASAAAPSIKTVQVFLDGADPVVAGAPLTLPRRERRILEFLVANSGRRVSKSHLFNAIYGLLDDDVDATVVESHVCKLRKKLRQRLGYDPIDGKRHLGYLYTGSDAKADNAFAKTSVCQLA
jgi:two-component system, OmpR family, flagellar system response regulator FtcR